MGNTQCCHAKEENDYKSQVLPEAVVNLQPKENLPPNISQKSQKDEKPEEILEIPIPEPPITIEVVEEKPVEIPILHPIIRLRLESEKFFEDKLKGELKVRKFGEEVYEGQLDQNSKYPHGYGRMYKADGSLYVGHFQHGKAEGQGVYLSPDGLLYNGHFHNNNAQGIGKYEYSGITYEGHFLNNRFNGTGKEKSESYEFEGEYYEGQRTHGVFKWENEKGEKYIYTGHFFKNKFHGEGILGEPKGTYAGSFIDGHKDGRGIYKYTTGLRYQGEYRKGVKQGKGIIYNFNNTIAYEGEFENDMPHGKGYIYDDERNRHSTIWVEGIDSSLL